MPDLPLDTRSKRRARERTYLRQLRRAKRAGLRRQIEDRLATPALSRRAQRLAARTVTEETDAQHAA